MTWTYEKSDDGTEIDVFDHNGEYVETIYNDGSGFSLRDVKDVMRAEAENARHEGDMDRWRSIHIRLADNDVKLSEGQ